MEWREGMGRSVGVGTGRSLGVGMGRQGWRRECGHRSGFGCEHGHGYG